MNIKGIVIVFACLFLFNVISAGCSVVQRTDCIGTNYTTMGLSSLTNAHGELASQGNYNYVLCCDFGTGNTTCSGTNKIIGLESATNSHAEIPNLDNYANDVCYENLVCMNKSTCGPSETEILSLPNGTSAPIGGAGDYLVKICCTGICGDGFLNPGEQCDDGNDKNGDDCSNTCRDEADDDEKRRSGGGSDRSDCNVLWDCSSWSSCNDGFKTRTCIDLRHCGTSEDKPDEIQECGNGVLSSIGSSILNLGETSGESKVGGISAGLVWMLILAIIIIFIAVVVLLLR